MEPSQNNSDSPEATSKRLPITKSARKVRKDGNELPETIAPRLGRPPEPVPEDQADAIIDWLSAGRPLAEWARNAGVHVNTIYRWLEKDEVFRGRYARARETAGDAIAERMRILAATPSDHPDDVQHRRLMLDTDKWLLARWYPNRYGDKVGIEHNGQVTLKVVTGVPEP